MRLQAFFEFLLILGFALFLVGEHWWQLRKDRAGAASEPEETS